MGLWSRQNPLIPRNWDTTRIYYLLGQLVNDVGEIEISGDTDIDGSLTITGNTLLMGDGTDSTDKQILFNNSTADPGIMWDYTESKVMFSWDGSNWYPIKYFTYGNGIEITDNPSGMQGTIAVDLATASGLKFDTGLKIALRTTSPCLEIEDEGVLGLNYILDVKDLGGDLSGTVINATVAKIQGRAVQSSAPSDGQYLKWVAASSEWQAATITQTFLGLTDTPSSYSGKAGCLPIVNATPDALEFTSLDADNSEGEIKFNYDTTAKEIGAELNINVGSAGFYGDRGYRQKITIDHTKVSSTITDMRVLITTSSASNTVFSKSQSDGDDICFTDTSNNLLPFELVTFTPTGGSELLIAYVKVTVSHLTDTEIYMYYGNLAATSEESPANTWTNFDGVYHFENSLTDSSGNARDGTTHGSTDTTGAIVGRGRFYDPASSQYDSFGTALATTAMAGYFTINLWINNDDGTPRIVLGATNGSSDQQMYLYLNKNAANSTVVGSMRITVRSENEAAKIYAGFLTPQTEITDGAWHYHTVSWNLDASNYDMYYWIDGQPVTLEYNTRTKATGTWVDWSDGFPIGCFGNDGTEGYFYSGYLDEVWFFDGTYSNDLAEAYYNNQSSPSTFSSFGAEESGTYYNGQEIFELYIDPAKDHADAVDAINGLVKGDGSGGYSAVTDNSTTWNKAWVTDSDQTGITGDKSGSFDISTSGTIGGGAITGTSLSSSGGGATLGTATQAGTLTLHKGDGTTATLSYTKWADLEAVSGLVKCNGSGDYSAITDNSTNWNTAYGWGDHAGLYTPLAHKTTEDAITGLVKVDGAGNYSGVTDSSSNWNTAYTNRVDTWTSPLQFSGNTASILSVFGEDRRNVTVVWASATTVDVDFDILQVEMYNLTAGNLTIAITTSGANGLDTGSEAVSTWYAVYVIYNPSTSTIAGLLSADTTPPTTANAPTLPSGYTVWRHVGWVRNDGSGDFTTCCCLFDVLCDRGDPSAEDFTALTTDGTEQTLDLSSIIPPGAKSCLFKITIQDDVVQRNFTVYPYANTNTYNSVICSTHTADVTARHNGEVILNSGRQVHYRITNATITTKTLIVTGWRF